MSKGFVSVRHPMRIFLLLYRIAPVPRSLQYFVCQSVYHRLLAAAARIRNQPSNGQAVSAGLLVHFDRYLVSRAANSPGLNLHSGLHIINGPLENFEWVVLVLGPNILHSAVE